MNALVQHFRVSMLLYVRNKVALLYGYLFPILYYIAFLSLYPDEQPALMRHMGEVLTIAILGAACLSMPTAIVNERERGVWRRYRIAPIAEGGLLASTLAARFAALLVAGGIQLLLGMRIGHWLPAHPFDLLLAFSAASFAFLGIGLVFAMVTDTVGAVQGLGQIIFLPMLVLGGVAVPLHLLPVWVQHLSAFLPGRYAVETVQACVTGDGLASLGFNLSALVLIGLCGSIAGAKLFRWDARERFGARGSRAWIWVVLAAWAVVGVLAEVRREAEAASRWPAISRAPLASTVVAQSTQDSP